MRASARSVVADRRPESAVVVSRVQVAYGGIFYPYIAHLHYNFLEKLVVVRWATPTVRVPWAKMFIEQFVYWSYFTNAYYHAVLGALQGMSVSQVYHRVESTLWDTLKAQYRRRETRSRLSSARLDLA
jgi:hypothetical protein